MAFINWTDQLSVNIRQIDDQHKKLVSIINTLFDAMSQGKAKDVLGKVFNELIQYTKTHFQNEERMMQQYSYPDFAAHKKEHDDLTKTAMDLQDKFTKGAVSLSIETSNFLKAWLTKHILGTDKKYSPFLNGKGVV
ncbi:MAG: bacteriohemerythrin [Lentisphaerota bacterium]